MQLLRSRSPRLFVLSSPMMSDMRKCFGPRSILAATSAEAVIGTGSLAERDTRPRFVQPGCAGQFVHPGCTVMQTESIALL